MSNLRLAPTRIGFVCCIHRLALAAICLAGLLAALTAAQSQAAGTRSFQVTVYNQSSYTVRATVRPSVGATLSLNMKPGAKWTPTLTTSSNSNWVQFVAYYGNCQAGNSGNYTRFYIHNSSRGCPITTTRS